MKSPDDRPWSQRFVPAERWILPAQRPATAAPAPAEPPGVHASVAAPENTQEPRRTRVVAGFGLCVSFVLAACGSHDRRPAHVGPSLGDTHVSRAPTDPTVPPPDAPDWEQPSPGLPIQGATGTAPVPPGQPAEAPAPAPAQPGVFSPPPPPENPPDAAQPQIPQPSSPSTTPLPQQ